MLKNIFFNGQIPYFSVLKRILSLIPLFALIIFIKPEMFKDFGVWGWWILLFIVFIRPLSDILPKLGLLRSITILRKELGIIAGSFILAHVIGFFLKKDLPIIASLFSAKFWNFQSFFGWGTLGLFLTIIILLTSNKWAIKLLKKYWKPVQRLTYLLALATAIHISLVNPENKITSSFIVALLIVVWILANRKIKIWK